MIAKKMISNIISILVISTFMLAQVGPVYAADTGSISGVIKDADNNPIIGTQIQVRAVLKSDNSQVAFTMSDPADGTYLLADLPLDTDLAVIASDEDPDSDGFAGQYFSDAWIDWAETIVLTSTSPDRAGVNFSLKDGSSVAVEALTFNVRSGRLLEDLNLRKAIAYGTDRQAILDGAFVPEGSNGEIMHTMVSPNAWYLADPADLTIYNYNKAQAETILSNAGWTDTDADNIRENASNEELKLDFISVMRPSSMAAAELFKSQMLEIGILVNVLTYPYSGFWDQLTTGDFDIAEFGWGLADDYDELINVYNTGDELNLGGFESAAMDGYFNAAHQAKLTGDLSAFEGNASNWQIAFTEELPALPLFTRSGSLRPLPTFGVRANEERVEGWGWQDGSTVTIEIDHDDDGNPEISRTALVGPASWNPDEIRFEYDFRGEYDILPGDKITVTDGTITKETYVSVVSITAIDVSADIVSGVSDPETNVDVAVCNQSGCYNRHVVAAAVTGVWYADFAHAGPGDDEQDIVDVAPWDWVDASYRDFDEDNTSYGIGVPNPRFQVRANEDRVEGSEWEIGDTLTIEVSRPGDTISDTVVVGTAPWDANQSYFDFRFDGAFDILPGDLVSVTDGSTTKTTTVTPLSYTAIDMDLDIVNGLASPGAEVNIWACEPNGGDCHNRHITADAVDGTWQADFGNVGTQSDEQTTLDFVPSTWIDSEELDVDSDSTMYGYNIPNPFIEADRDRNWVHARDWPNGTLMTMEIDDVTNGLGGVDYTDTATMAQAPWNPGDPNDILADFDMSGFSLKTGDVITITGDMDGSPVSKELVISPLQATAFDVNADTISGLATPGAQVEVCVNREFDCLSRIVTANAVTGAWTADYASEHDLQPGQNGWAAEIDAESDRNQHEWRILSPFIEANRDRNWVHARDWPNGTLMTMEIDDVSNGLGGVDYTDTATMGQAPWNPGDPNDIAADFDMSGFTLKAGDVITITGEIGGLPVSKELSISSLRVDGFDLDAETISGLATPGADLEVCVNRDFDCLSRFVTADSFTGAWTANYDPDHDLQRGQNGWVAEYDTEADQNWHDWDIPNPHMDAWFDGDSISAYGWPDGDEITLSIEDPTTLASPDYTTTATVGISPWDPNQTVVDFNLGGIFDFAPGMVITIESSFATKELTVVPLSVTQINLSTDVVGGLTAPNQEMWMHHPDSCCRVFQSSASGAWQVDYSVVGPGGEPVADIIPGSSGAINANDADGDNTSLGWTAPNYPETLSIQRASANPTSADSVDFTVTFTELVADVDVNDFAPDTTGSITGASVTAVTPVSGSIYTVTVAIGFGNGTLRIDIPSSATIVDTYGNSLIGLPYTSGQAYDVNKIIPDTTPPSVVSSLRANPSPSNAASVDFTVTFSEAVTGVAVNDFAATVTGAISGASVTSVTPVSASVYTVTVNTGSGNGTLRLDIPSSSTIADLAANPLTGLPYTTGQVYEINKTIPDTTPPSVVSSVRANPSPSNAASVDFTVTFSEAVTGVAVNDFAATVTGAISGASVTSVTPVSASIYTVTVNTGSGNGTLRLDIPSSATIADLAANPLTGLPYTTGQVYEINKTIPDTTPPSVVSSVRANPSPSNAASVDFTVTFSEAVTGVAVNDFAATVTGTISGASVTSVTPVSALVYTVTVSTGSGNGTLRLDIPSSATIADLAANPLAGLPYITGQVYQIRTQTFSDVPASYWAWQYIERLYNAGITGGCSTDPTLAYCPDSTVTRAQMAVFLEKGIQGSDFKPPLASGTRFTDVPSTYWAAAWIEQLAKDGITGGCGEGIYCPDSVVTRAQMAVFLLKSKYGASYTPPNLDDSGSGFTDVPAGYWAAPWIKQLAAEGITGGCGAGVYCPEAAVTRAQMAVFLVKAFNLP